MASKNHQVGIEINADVRGQESIAELTDRLDDAAKVLGGELKTRAQQAAAELRELGAQDAAIKAFRSLKQEAADGARALKSIEGEVASFSKQINAVGPPTAREAAELQKLQAAASAVSAKLAQQNQALGQATADLQRFGIASNATQAAQQRLTEKTQALRDSVKDLAPAYQSATTSIVNSAAVQNRSHRGIKEGVSSISEQLALMQKLYVGFAGLQGFASMAKDVAETADAYNNLQARIKLVTGEGPAFQTAFEGVTAVAQRTSSSLESTGNLFAKLAQAGQAMGVGQAEALKLTETVNQAVQLSGASAQASDAAITQLIQGLQGGVLRGDEFNSVMEQSPRLAKALADGLGSTTGELRKMAEAGQLSSEIVIKALQGQSDAVATEFAKLPPTVGRAIQNLSTSWTLYVGETDKAMGASSAAAGAINALSNNLSTVAGFLIDAGQAAAALAAIRLAQYFLGVGVAATTATTAVVANTVAVTAAGAAAGVAGSVAAVGVSRLVVMMRAFWAATPLGLLLLIVTNFHDIGTAIGEAAAKLMGYKDRTKELAEEEKVRNQIAADGAAQRTRMAAATQLAIDKSFELGNAGRAAITEFDKLTKEGTSAADAIAKIGKDFDLATIPGIRNATAVLDKLAADGKLTATEFQKAWSDALKGSDLAVFETQARAALAGTAREAERVAQVLDATLRESIKRTGLDFEVISGGMGKASQSAINDTEAIIAGLDRLKAMGVDTAQVLTASIGKGISTADSQQAIEALRAQIEAVRKVLGDKVADGLLDQAKLKAEQLTDALEKAKPGVDSLREAMKLLGVTSDETLKNTATQSKAAYEAMRASGTASARELSEGFKKYATDAIAAHGGVASEALKVEAALRGVSIQTDATGKAIVKSMEGGAQSIKTVEDAYKQLGLKTPEELNKIAAANKAAWDKISGDSNASMESLKKAFATYAQSALDAAGDIGSEQRIVTQEVLKTEAALKGLTIEFDKNGKVIVKGQGEAQDALEKTRDAVDDVTAALMRQNEAQEKVIAAQEKANALAERKKALEDKQNRVDSEGFQLNNKGERLSVSTPTARSIYENAKGQGLTPEQALQISQQFFSTSQQRGGLVGRQNGENWGTDLQKAIDRLVLQNAAHPAGVDTYGMPIQTPSGTPSTPAKTYTVNVNLGGSKTVINTSSEADAQALISLLQRAKLST